MIRFLLIALALAAGAGPAVAQQQGAPAEPQTYSQADLWSRSGDRIRFNIAGISLPTEAGAIRFVRSAEGSLAGRGLDNILQYASADQRIFGTVYVYAPALPDAALTAFMTDHVIQLVSGPDFRRLGSGTVVAGGRDGAAIRFDYMGARQERLASSAAFIRAGRWIVKVRVSGPESRRDEVQGTMTVLLREMRFDGEIQPVRAAQIALADCPAGPGRAARLLPADDAATAAEAIIANAGVDLPGSAVDMSAPGWCRSAGYRMPNAPGPTPVFRNVAPPATNFPGRRVLIALLADNGTMIEVVERRLDNRTRYVLMHHQIGRTLVLGSYDLAPTDEQLRAIERGEDREGGRARAVITYQASGDSNVTVMVAPSAPTT